MIQSAGTGAIRITSTRPVYRRYALADELIAIGIAEGGVGPSTFDSGGPLVEMAELAQSAAAVVCPEAVITRGEVDSRQPDRYHSDGRDPP